MTIIAITDYLRRYMYVCHSVGGKSKWMCSVSTMTCMVLCIFAVAVGSQLSRMSELRYAPITVTSLLTSKSPSDDHTHWFNSTAVSTTSETATTLLSATHANYGQSKNLVERTLSEFWCLVVTTRECGVVIHSVASVCLSCPGFNWPRNFIFGMRIYLQDI